MNQQDKTPRSLTVLQDIRTSASVVVPPREINSGRKKRRKRILFSDEQTANLIDNNWPLKMMGAKTNTVHLDYPYAFCNLDSSVLRSVARTQGEVAHLALDATRMSSPSARHYPFLQDLRQHRFMERLLRPRGK